MAARGGTAVAVAGTALAAALAAALLLSGSAGGQSGSAPAGSPAATVSTGDPADPLAVLHAWDAARAAAWAGGDAAALRALYLPSADAGRRDVALLSRYRARGLSVQGMRMQTLRAQILELSAARMRIRVVERLAIAEAVARDGTRIALPSTRPGSREIVLVRRGHRWLVASARPVGAQAEAPVSNTAVTSGSAKR